MILILFGAPGIGKGTQAAILAEKYSLKVISTGDILRAEVAKGTEIGRRVQELIDKGLFPKDELVLDLLQKAMEEALKRGAKGIILDGVPRTTHQAEELTKLLKSDGEKVDAVIILEGDENTLIKRVEGRFLCGKCGTFYNEKTKLPQKEGICDICGNTSFIKREDDTKETLKMRLKIYHDQTEPIIPYYEKMRIVYRVDGLRPISEITHQIEKILKEKLDS